MREILFRGKRADNGEWASSGCLIHVVINEEHNFFISNKGAKSDAFFGENGNLFRLNNAGFYKVLPETVGQYTGLTDKNGKKIFEGDILDTPDRIVVVTWLDSNAQFDCDFLKYAHDIEIENFKGIFPRDFYKYKVIGNTHDNPELLGGDYCG